MGSCRQTARTAHEIGPESSREMGLDPSSSRDEGFDPFPIPLYWRELLA
jgi:hypothetical protein